MYFRYLSAIFSNASLHQLLTIMLCEWESRKFRNVIQNDSTNLWQSRY